MKTLTRILTLALLGLPCFVLATVLDGTRLGGRAERLLHWAITGN